MIVSSLNIHSWLFLTMWKKYWKSDNSNRSVLYLWIRKIKPYVIAHALKINTFSTSPEKRAGKTLKFRFFCHILKDFPRQTPKFGFTMRDFFCLQHLYPNQYNVNFVLLMKKYQKEFILILEYIIFDATTKTRTRKVSTFGNDSTWHSWDFFLALWKIF